MDTTPRGTALQTVLTALNQCADLAEAWGTDDSQDTMDALSRLAHQLRTAATTRVRQPNRLAGNTICEATAMEPRNSSIGHGIRRF